MMKLNAQNIVNNILNNNKDNLCPMEQKATELKDNELFFGEISSAMK